MVHVHHQKVAGLNIIFSKGNMRNLIAKISNSHSPSPSPSSNSLSMASSSEPKAAACEPGSAAGVDTARRGVASAESCVWAGLAGGGDLSSFLLSKRESSSAGCWTCVSSNGTLNLG